MEEAAGLLSGHHRASAGLLEELEKADEIVMTTPLLLACMVHQLSE